MNTPKKRAALIYGGRGAEREVSCEGAKYVLPLMRDAGYDVMPVFIDEGGNWLALSNGGSPKPTYPVRLAGKSGFLTDGKIIPCSVALPLLHGDFGEDGTVQGALECAMIPYVGARVLSSAVSLDKSFAKLAAESLGIPTAPWLLVYPSEASEVAQARAEAHLGYPMFIKPCSAGSSFGAHPVLCREDFGPALTDAAGYGDGRVLVEKMLSPIREIEVAFFECKSPPIRIITEPGEVAADGFYDYEEKYSPLSRAKILPKAELPRKISEKIREYAEVISEALELRQLGRLDFFLLGEEIYFNEVNTMPGFTEGSLYPKMINEAGISPSGLISLLLSNIEDGLL